MNIETHYNMDMVDVLEDRPTNTEDKNSYKYSCPICYRYFKSVL